LDSDVLLGISGGLLSLVGLIAIFISINTQHSIEKARDILLELELFRLEHPQTDLLTAKKIRSKIDQYKRLIKMSISTILVIGIAIVTMLFVGISWLVYLDGLFVKISCSIMLAFTFCLILLTRVSFIGALPKANIFKNINTVYKGINMKDLFAMSLQCNISVRNNRLKRLRIHSPLEMKNIEELDVNIHYIKNGEYEVVEYHEFDLVRGNDRQKRSTTEIKGFSPQSFLEVPISSGKDIAFNEIKIGLLIILEDGMLTVIFKIPNSDNTEVGDPRTVLTPSSYHFSPFNSRKMFENWDKEYDFTNSLLF